MSARFKEIPCTVAVSNNFDTHGTITRSSIDHLTPDDLEALFKPGGLYADMDAWFQTSFEMQACGTQVNGLYDWLMSSYRSIGGLQNYTKVDRGPSLLQPFVLARQDSVINKEFWAITQGYANGAYTAAVTGPLTADDKTYAAGLDANYRIIRVVTRYGFDMDAKWFNDRDRIMIFGLAANGQSTRGQWRVAVAEAAADSSYVDVAIVSENAGSSTPYATAPTAGVVLRAGNNVNDFESFCANRPTQDPRKRVPFWVQTMRRIRSVDSEYLKVFERLMESNQYFREFGDLPLAERNRQDEVDFQRNWLITFFFGKAISASQTMALWENLESILTVTGTNTDPGLGGKVIAKRANIVGVREQMQACGQVRDLQNQLLNFYEFLDENYRIMRARKSQGKAVTSLDWFTDAVFAAEFETAVINYYRQEYGDIIRIEVETGGNEWGFSWRTFTVKFPVGVKINIITHDFFNDLVDAGTAESVASSTRFLLCLEMGKPGPKGGTIYPGMTASNRKVRTLGELENLARVDRTFACTMEHITEEITLSSETCTAVVECPANSLWIEGIREGVPLVTGKSSNPTYTNLY